MNAPVYRLVKTVKKQLRLAPIHKKENQQSNSWIPFCIRQENVCASSRQDCCKFIATNNYHHYKNKTMKHFTFFTSRILFLFIAAFLFASCSHKRAFEKSLVVPSASGQVKVKKDANNNYSINVYARDLTTPDKLIPSKKVYVVWNEASNGVFNLGQLVTSRSFFKRGYTASLSATSPNKPKRVFVTAEDDANTLSPGTQVVVTTSNF